MQVFACQEQIDESGEEFQLRNLIVTPSAILLTQPIAESPSYGVLIAWATLQSIARLRKNSAAQQFLSIIFKPMEERQPWVLNLVVPKYEECTKLIVGNLTSLGVNNKAVKVKSQHVDRPKIAHHEVTKEAIMQMDINEVVTNMQAYEEEVLMSESDAGSNLTLSTVQTLITLYQKAIEYYSAMDDNQYIDVRNRMQSLLARPDVEALMASKQEENAKSDAQMAAASNEEEKTGQVEAQDETNAAKEISYKIDDDEDEDEEEEKKEESKEVEKPKEEANAEDAKEEEQ